MGILNFRVFRRNAKNLILLWSSGHLTEDQKSIVTAFLVDPLDGMSDGRELKWSKFVPDNPEKFTQDVCGIVIQHSTNAIDSAKSCAIKVMLGHGEDAIELIKEVLPANAIGDLPRPAVDASRRLHMYAFDSSTGAWIPWPANGVIPSNIQIIAREQD